MKTVLDNYGFSIEVETSVESFEKYGFKKLRAGQKAWFCGTKQMTMFIIFTLYPTNRIFNVPRELVLKLPTHPKG